jgi:hypothetical protein
MTSFYLYAKCYIYFTLRVANLNALFSIFSFGEQGMQALLDLLFAVEGSVSEAAKFLG